MGSDEIEVGEAEFCNADGGEYSGDEDENEDEIRAEETASARAALAKLPTSCFTSEDREELTEDGWKEYLKAVKVSGLYLSIPTRSIGRSIQGIGGTINGTAQGDVKVADACFASVCVAWCV
jgi:hypothetical protein